MGHGDDEVGSYYFAGEYNQRTLVIKFKKQYIGKHAVLYEGKLNKKMDKF
jgi:hypothetical protein